MLLEPIQIVPDLTTNSFLGQKDVKKGFSCYTLFEYSISYIASACFVYFFIVVGFGFVLVVTPSKLVYYSALAENVFLQEFSFRSTFVIKSRESFRRFVYHYHNTPVFMDVFLKNILMEKLKYV